MMELSTPREHFNPRSPHGERRASLQGCNFNRRISIHAPRTGSDLPRTEGDALGTYFNPRSPHGERRGGIRERAAAPTISIHAPRTGSDGRDIRMPQIIFNKFQSTLPARGATCSHDGCIATHIHFNPRSPHGERHALPILRSKPQNFNPRSPHGERLAARV